MRHWITTDNDLIKIYTEKMPNDSPDSNGLWWYCENANWWHLKRFYLLKTIKLDRYKIKLTLNAQKYSIKMLHFTKSTKSFKKESHDVKHKTMHLFRTETVIHAKPLCCLYASHHWMPKLSLLKDFFLRFPKLSLPNILSIQSTSEYLSQRIRDSSKISAFGCRCCQFG